MTGSPLNLGDPLNHETDHGCRVQGSAPRDPNCRWRGQGPGLCPSFPRGLGCRPSEQTHSVNCIPEHLSTSGLGRIPTQDQHPTVPGDARLSKAQAPGGCAHLFLWLKKKIIYVASPGLSCGIWDLVP